jgi:hypothetical protein
MEPDKSQKEQYILKYFPIFRMSNAVIAGCFTKESVAFGEKGNQGPSPKN